MSPEAKPHKNPSDGRPSERGGFNPPVIDEKSVQYHDLRSRTGISDEAARKQLGVDAGHPIETPELIKHKRTVLAQLAQDVADAEAAITKRAAAQASLRGILSGLDAAAAKLLEDKVIAACHGSPTATQNVINVLREIGLQR